MKKCGFIVSVLLQGYVRCSDTHALQELLELQRLEAFFSQDQSTGAEFLRIRDYQEHASSPAALVAVETSIERDDFSHAIYQILTDDYPSLSDEQRLSTLNGICASTNILQKAVATPSQLQQIVHKYCMKRCIENAAAVSFEGEETHQAIYDLTGNGCLVHESSYISLCSHGVKICPLTRKPLLEVPILVEDLVGYCRALHQERTGQQELFGVDDLIVRDVISLESFIVDERYVQQLHSVLPERKRSLLPQAAVAASASTSGWINMQKLVQFLQLEG